MATVSELIAGTYDYLGRPTQDKVSIGLVLPFLLDAVDYYNVDLQLSSENWLLKNYQYTPSTKDELVVAPGFSVPVFVEIRDVDSTSEADWKSVIISNVTDVQSLGSDGTRAMAFYGSPARARLSIDPEDSPVEVKLWYEPVGTLPSAIADSPRLSQAFHSMLKIRTALMCSAYLPNSEQLSTSLLAQLAGWERKWKLWTTIDRNASVVIKRDYRGARRTERFYY